MKKMGKLVISAVALVMCASVVFAGGKKESGTTAASKGVEIGIVLPTREEPRWIQDETNFKSALNGVAGVELLFSQGDSGKEKQNVEALLTKGIKVLIICPQDGAAAAAAAEAAAKEGVVVISYDRLITDTNAVDYYVTFDSVSVGKAQGQYLIDNLPAGTKGASLYLYAGAASDNNAFLFFEGAWSVLQPKIADGTFVIQNSDKAKAVSSKATLTRAEMGDVIGQITTDWDFNVAKKKAADNLTVASTAQKGDCFVLAPNDGTARAIADEFAKDGDVSKYYITGQDAESASLQYIIDGKQSMTVFKNTKILVNDAIDMAKAILAGKTPATTGSYNNNKKDVVAKQTAVTVVTKANVKQAITDGAGGQPASAYTGL